MVGDGVNDAATLALPVALLLGCSALLACMICIRSGQYDDLETPSVRLLNDELEQ